MNGNIAGTTNDSICVVTENVTYGITYRVTYYAIREAAWGVISGVICDATFDFLDNI